MDATPVIVKMVLAIVIALVMTLIARLARRSRRHEPGRVTGPAAVGGAGGAGGAVQAFEVPRQRPAPSMRVLGFIIIACGVVLTPLAALIPDPIGMIVIGLMGVAVVLCGVYVLRYYHHSSLVDAPTMTIMTSWRSRETRVVHEEITKYHAANRRTVVVRDSRGQKLSIDLVWFSAPLLARHLMQLEAEGRFAGNRIGDARRIAKGLSNVEYSFRRRFPDHYKAILLQGPGANPAAFQRDPAAPQGRGWTGPAYASWLQALQATLRG
ncbi:hypothetical protein J5X07_02840 [Actinomyces bowdenii]|uniref:hypothetical protein n=1 Tax=Actinomyces bowdenii TaxID=131109 RepID=UPI001ABC2EFF|nr:hypothetical protein [Actinomyces bowdenii]MBO3723978.1 hypothetical protein [Actinomyces bowdenii]